MRIGCGIDLHRLIVDPERPLMLGGFAIPSELALEGHSDADCVLHALTDAILGALALGDIGEYFPNTDPAWKNAPSEVFLEKALDEMRTRCYALGNVDIAICAEVPKLSPYKPAMRKRLSELLGIPVDRIGLKATTLEQLGALGRGEGMLAQAVVLLKPVDQPSSESVTPARAKSTLTPAEIVARDLASKPQGGSPVAKAPARRTAAAEPAQDSGSGKVLRAWTDGASRGNPGPSALGVLIRDASGEVIHEFGQVLGTATNNVAEYRALIYALQVALAFAPTLLEVRMDSELIVKQMRGEYRVKDANLAKLYAQAKAAEEQLTRVEYIHVRREENREADALANQALDADR